MSKKEEKTTAGQLAHHSNFFRAAHEKTKAPDPDQEPDVFVGEDEGDPLTPLEELLPTRKVRAHLNLPEPSFRPPVFLRPNEGMSATYMHTRGRMSRKTEELLKGPEFEDLLDMLGILQEDEALLRKNDARIKSKWYQELKDEPGPLLLGYQDPRLAEPWRLFLQEWDIWTISDEKGGVELFWEGEGEDEEGDLIDLSQSLAYQQGELTLKTQWGDEEETITFDGQAFYRLKSPGPSR